MKLKYMGLADIRRISPEDVAHIDGVELEDALEWSPKNGYTQLEVPEILGEYLLNAERGAWANPDCVIEDPVDPSEAEADASIGTVEGVDPPGTSASRAADSSDEDSSGSAKSARKR